MMNLSNLVNLSRRLALCGFCNSECVRKINLATKNGSLNSSCFLTKGFGIGLPSLSFNLKTNALFCSNIALLISKLMLLHQIFIKN